MSRILRRIQRPAIGTLVALPRSDVVTATSSDAIHWQTAANSIANHDYAASAYGNGTYCAIEYNSAGNSTSSDGVHWTRSTNIGSFSPSTFRYAAGNFICMSKGLAVWVSSDGASWGAYSLTANMSGCAEMAYGNGLLVATNSATSNKYNTSTDGMTWTERVLPYSGRYSAAGYFKGKFILLDSLYGRCLYSSDGITWNNSAFGIYESGTVPNRVACSDNLMCVATYNSSNVAVSSDGITWSNAYDAGVTASASCPSFIYHRALNLFILTGYATPNYAYSADGVTWNTGSLPFVLSSIATTS